MSVASRVMAGRPAPILQHTSMRKPSGANTYLIGPNSTLKSIQSSKLPLFGISTLLNSNSNHHIRIMSRPVRNSKFRQPGHVLRLLSGGDPDYELDLPEKRTKKAPKKNIQSEEERLKAQQEKADLLAKIEEDQLAEERAAAAAFPRSLKGATFDFGLEALALLT